MKYHCTHCSHDFELEEKDFRRCPKCFWTTSLIPFEERKNSAGAESSLPPSAKPALRTSVPVRKLFFVFLICTTLSILIVIFAKFSFQLPYSIQNIVKPKVKEPLVPGKKSGESLISFLNAEEKNRLLKPFQLTIPRKLTEDEEEILKKQVSIPQTLSEKPKLLAWSEGDFEKMLESEQKKRKVYLGWAYVRAVKKTFEKYVPSAMEAYEKGDYVLARDLFLTSLTFPIYRNDPRRHRAIALVILRPYINDIIGKVAVLNQYLMTQQLATEVNSLFQSYQTLFPVLELQEWDRASQLITELKRRVESFEHMPQTEQLSYGRSFGLLDPEIQMAIQTEAAPKPEAAVNLKTLMIDLNLKEQVVRQNRGDELLKAQKQYEEILSLLEEGNLEEARTKLGTIEAPPELVQDARTKIALIDQTSALQKTKQEKGQ
jgi:hypothetical protein